MSNFWDVLAKNASPKETYYPDIGLVRRVKYALGFGDPEAGRKYREAAWITKQIAASFVACKINTPGDRSETPGLCCYVPAADYADPAYNFKVKLPSGVRAQRFNDAFLEDLRSRLGGFTPELTINEDGVFIRVPLERVPARPPKCTLADLGQPPDDYKLPLPLGRAQRAPYWVDLARAPHTLFAGASGSGKSTLIHACLHFLLDRADVWGVDLKLVELSRYKSQMVQLATEPEEVEPLLEALFRETRRRLAELQSRNQNDWQGRRIVLVVDELAEVTLASKGDTTLLLRLAQLGRAAGVHLLLATQRPSVQIIPGDMKANVPLRVCLALPTAIDSQVVLGKAGAELLTPPGDAYVLDGHRITRVSTPNYKAPEAAFDLTQAEDPRLLGLSADERAAYKAIQEEGCKATQRGLVERFHWGTRRAMRTLKSLRNSGVLEPAPADVGDDVDDISNDVADVDDLPPTDKVFMEPQIETPAAVGPLFTEKTGIFPKIPVFGFF
ncbi:MAG: hypothetical protein JXB47_03985 [Anaerolineae bacterium]|nr:hypothetical protein [Anaerolineae bacterium]